MACNIVSNNLLLLGKVVPCLKKDAAKVLIKTLEFDDFIHMYFKRFDFIYAHDPDKLCKSGDIVLVQKLQERLSQLLTHKVVNVVFPLGDVVDPVTGKRVMASEYRDVFDEKINRFGAADTKFKYEEAPPRGWQENKKDFSHLKTYVKYHVFDDDSEHNDAI